MPKRHFLDRYGDQMRAAIPSSAGRTTTRRPRGFTRSSVVVAVVSLGVVGGGVGAAVALTGGDDPGRWAVVTASPSAGESSPAAPRPRRPEGEALRAATIERIALLRRSAGPADAVPADVVPKDAPGSPLRVSEKDLKFARQVPGADAWLVPLASGHLLLMTSRGGAEFAPQQIDDGSMVFSNATETGEVTVTGVVADGTTDVTIDTTAGPRPAEIHDGTYSVTLPPSTHPRSITLTTANGQRTIHRING